MSSTYSVTAAQTQLPRLLRQAEKVAAVSIRRRSETVAYLVSRERMEAIVEAWRDCEVAEPDARTARAISRASSPAGR